MRRALAEPRMTRFLYSRIELPSLPLSLSLSSSSAAAAARHSYFPPTKAAPAKRMDRMKEEDEEFGRNHLRDVGPRVARRSNEIGGGGGD